MENNFVTLIHSGKPIKALDKVTADTLEHYQHEVRRRFKEYKRGRQQGLGMVFDNMQNELKFLFNSHKDA